MRLSGQSTGLNSPSPVLFLLFKEREEESVDMSNYQVMPELTAEEYAELKADIALRGVMVPI